MLLGRLAVAELVVQPGQLDLGIGRARLTLHPTFDQPKGLFVAPLLGQQHGQPTVAVGVVGIPIQAEVVVGFRLIQVGLAVFDLADAMIGGREIVVGVGIVRVGVGRLLELFGGLLVSGLLEEPDPLGVSPLGVKPAAAGQPEKDRSQRKPLHAQRHATKPVTSRMSGCDHGAPASPKRRKREDSDRRRWTQERFLDNEQFGGQCKRKEGEWGKGDEKLE